MTSNNITLQHILSLVGPLDDTPGQHTARERFRLFLQETVTEVGQLRDYIDECLRLSGEQYFRSLQDLVNHLGQFLGFSVTYGRYQGVTNQIGFDGHWVSKTDFHIVVEVKSSETYPIKTSTLIGYVDHLISDRKIASWDSTLGLYIVGKINPEIRNLENAIVAEKRTSQLRVISVDSLMSLAELMQDYDVTHEDILAIFRPISPKLDTLVELISRLTAGPRPNSIPQPEELPTKLPTANTSPMHTSNQEDGSITYWITSVRSDEQSTAAEVIKTIVGKDHIYAFGQNTPGRKHLKPGDKIAFYETGNGVIGHATVDSIPENKPHPNLRHPEKYPWTFRVKAISLYLENPVIIDADLRGQLDVFQNRDAKSPWAWFVQATRKIPEHDFSLLTRN